MDTNEMLRSFMEQMQHIKPPYGDLMNNGVPAMAQTNVAAERTQEMQRLAVYFAKAYQSKTATADEVQARSDDLEAAIMSVAMYGVLDDAKTTKLLDAMQELTAKRGE